MSVTYGVSDLFPHVCAVYRCACGTGSPRHGRLAGRLPEGWVEHAGRHLCERCVPNDADQARRSAPSAPVT